MNKHKAVFQEELGSFRGPKAKIHINPDKRPVFKKPHTVPHTLKPAVE